MKPKPLVALNHLTVPVAMSSILSSVCGEDADCKIHRRGPRYTPKLRPLMQFTVVIGHNYSFFRTFWSILDTWNQAFFTITSIRVGPSVFARALSNAASKLAAV